jgi:hypothetical protein
MGLKQKLILIRKVLGNRFNKNLKTVFIKERYQIKMKFINEPQVTIT